MIGNRGADLDELEALYRRRFGAFVSVAAGIAGEQAVDAVQEAFATAVRKRRTFRRAGSLDAWVWRLVVNSARDLARRRPQPVSSAPTAAAVELADELREAVAGLPERQRAAHHPLLTDADFRPVLGFGPHAGYPYVTLWVGRPPYRNCYRISYGVGTPINTCVDPAHTRLKLEALRRDGGPFLLSGYAGQRGATSLEIRFSNHASRRITLHNGFLLAELARGAHPTIVVARNAGGSVVWTRPFVRIVRRR